ncbi:MAG: saccharopine dehydrogenase NADP-binding domain-containing protein [Oscillospiraceae bacterium]|nr:saccharopine dehydrogenase NADP-binding domain-containing protein [Oscillospiraceae bacterium]
MKKVLILGAGAQGTTVAQRLDEHPGVGEIVCADYDEKAVAEIVKILKKARGVKVDGSKVEEIVKIAQGVDLIVNALPVEFGKQVLEAAIAAKANYQDFASVTNIVDEDTREGFIRGFEIMFDEYSKRFAEIGKTALICTGSAPGLICVVARRAVRELDSCETINMLVYEGGEAKRFQPFWWSPVVALEDMAENGLAFEDGKFIETEAFSRPLRRKFPEMDGKEVTMVEHNHEEPLFMGMNADKYFKGAKNIYFKYGGAGLNFAWPLYRAGLLSFDEVEIDGQMVCPFDVILHHLPPAPKYREEIKAIIDEGLVADEGAFVVEAYGVKDGKQVMVDAHIAAPGIVESFERAGLTAEMYLTGQCGYLFTKMFVEDKFTQHGLISSDMLTEEQIDGYLADAAKLDITLSLGAADHKQP